LFSPDKCADEQDQNTRKKEIGAKLGSSLQHCYQATCLGFDRIARHATLTHYLKQKGYLQS
jgi:hypothetical protein